MLYGIPAASIPEVWGEVCPWIAAACRTSRGKFDENDILRGLLDRDDQLWIWKTPTAFAVGVTRLVHYPKQMVCTVRIVTGRNRREWEQQCVEQIEAWAKAQGCHAMELQARPGWEKVLAGYDKTHVYLEKQL
ncbi:hypothetical protein WK62_05185 [Burkholderia ubonensis]|uniref:hypothetical protein n=1 Tax=Burkholderia ubonensis TaxID=101571 RepID=UPI00075F581C|nr:hypothetical protein [Burkholderia ubonensis]KVU10659.1 hypothetical protein WK62_05185 [Burkholderia ubonensis]